jgi:thioredoxin reductase/NAD-dependent dihydropyrimidine dehydrogenase PreA subunit
MAIRMESTIVYLGFFLVLVVPAVRHLRATRRREAAALAATRARAPDASGPSGQHPHIDVSRCIGCAACADVCPEGDVLGIVGGKAAIIHGEKCIGHGLCAEACPVGAIELVLAPPGIGADLPRLTPDYESTVPNLFVAGELGGLALIKNAVNQGRDCVDTIAGRLRAGRGEAGGIYDVCIVGAGPAGISASLRAIERKLRYVTLEQGELGGTVAHYPRRKLVMTSPVELPLYGSFRKLEISKENLLRLWRDLAERYRLRINTEEAVEQIRRDPDGCFTVTTGKGLYRARAVVLALGRRGTPRKLGIPGEELPKVMYSLLDAEAYTGARILVVGGGDSAVEAALGLAHQSGNRVTLSYRRDTFSRLKARNETRLNECVRSGKVELLMSSQPIEIRGGSVVLQVAGKTRELANDYVWIFAGGVSPNAFLEQLGVGVGAADLTEEAARAAQLAAAS